MRKCFARSVAFSVLVLPVSAFLATVNSGRFGTRTIVQASQTLEEAFVLSFDGAVAETAPWRAQQGLRAALETWPHLQSNDNNDWLLNKMAALSHVMQERSTYYSLGCEYGLLARLLMEEQELDQGRSVGKRGKYASQFHPSSSSASQPPREASQGSRPLTVGEIAANWNEGGCLCESLPARYNVQGRNPLVIMQEKIQEGQEFDACPLPVVNPAIRDALLACAGNVYVTVGHSCDLPIAAATLEKSGIQVLDSSTDKAGTVSLVSHTSIQTDQTKSLEQIIGECVTKQDTTVFLVTSSWRSLQKARRLYSDDDMPRQMQNGIAKACVNNKNINLSLNLPLWADNTHPTQHNQAEMDPWINVMKEDDLTEILSARIVSF